MKVFKGKLEDTPDILLPNKYISETAPEAYDMYIQGTNHFNYTDLALFSPTMVKMIMGSIGRDSGTETDPLYVIEKMNEISLNFFDSYLKDEGEFILPTLEY